jgi:hypothetical protein
MEALPVPALVPAVIHDGTPAAVQLQEAPVESDTLPLLPADEIESELGDSDELKQGCAAWVTVVVTPAIVSVPMRAAPGLASKEYVMVAGLPKPDDGVLIVTHAGVALAFHVHDPEGLLNVTVALPAELGTEALAGERVAPMQRFAPWVTVKLVPATLKVAVRPAPGFADAVRLSVALPVPDVATVIQSGFPVTNHVHDPGAVIEVEFVPPPGTKVRLACETVGAGMHGSPAWVTVSGLPAIPMIALRAAPVFAAATQLIEVIDPEVGVSVIHDGTPVAVHVQVALPLMLTQPLPPEIPAATDEGVRVRVEQGFPAWVTVNAMSATVKLALREVPVVLRATE